MNDENDDEDDEIDVGNSDDSRCCKDIKDFISSNVSLTEERNEWTFEEKQLFQIGYEEFGNKWSKIANLIHSKSISEVQIYAKNYLRVESKHVDSKVSIFSTSEITRIKKTEQESDQDDVDIGFDIEDPGSSKFPDITANERVDSKDSSNDITEEEKQIHSEFFSGNTKKSPERYVRIRSHILKSWDKCKPQYLTKVAARSGLRNCGDINLVGKIHSYLENIGVINSNCKGSLQKRKTTSQKKSVAISPKRMSLRKRNAPAENKFEIMEMKDKGVTIEHGTDGSEINRLIRTEKKVKIIPRSSPNKNPFQLVPCYAYNKSKPAPFELSVDLQAQFLAETHSYLFESEVIGLFGGSFNSETCQLEIDRAVPCKSLSTGVECEMDPVSQSEKAGIEKETFDVIGKKIKDILTKD